VVISGAGAGVVGIGATGAGIVVVISGAGAGVVGIGATGAGIGSGPHPPEERGVLLQQETGQ